MLDHANAKDNVTNVKSLLSWHSFSLLITLLLLTPWLANNQKRHFGKCSIEIEKMTYICKVNLFPEVISIFGMVGFVKKSDLPQRKYIEVF